ncbi:MAG: hypothetical protein GTO53_12975, partial [Planctomycetales bacterium]|nr:hypothetical protein [Planctomycetales bacterium]NIM10012.1 hypothetical protein [Planctomycetales bacterium]NIN09455.1 hypothetical protein [Planctomycetales bacterium]NIN78563.1 hypothetical protein [Planctomycetales bacterium]NIO35757.1 hypothetical protein [Planctomycetales bacterium]
LPLASLCQYRLRLAVDRQLAEIEQYHAESQAQAQRLARLQARLADQHALAQLTTFLQHPWPQTQIVAALLQPLPDSMSLDEVVVQREDLPGIRKVAPPDRGPQDPAPRLPAGEDLQILQKQAAGRLVVQLSGRTADSRELHHYLSALGQHPLFTQVELDSIQRDRSRDGHESLARFEAHLSVRSACGSDEKTTLNPQVAQPGPTRKHWEQSL